ncbi:MAG TPA: MFS transporter [Kofleriaceae bacterium]|nr:MFS transporter [Kofleriaceae bacterium]
MHGGSLAPPVSAGAPPRPDASQALPTLDVRRWIDDRPVGGFQLATVVTCAAIVFLDGFDAQVMGYVAPALRVDLHVERAALGPALSSGLFGMLIGALVFGPVADRYGRRPVLIACPLIFGLGSLLTATADSMTALVMFRLLTGLGMGGAMPNTIALTAEYMPRRVRASAVMTMFCGFSIGAAAVGWVAAALIPGHGWRSVFVVGGIVPCVLVAASAWRLPESIRFLLRRPGGEERARAHLARIAPAAPRDGRLVFAEEDGRGFVVGQLFAAGRRWLTPLLWAMFFLNLLDLYFVNSWLPTVMHDVGISERRAILITTLFQVGGTVGAVVLGKLLDRQPSFRMLAVTYLAGALCVFLIGESGTSSGWLVATVFASGFGVIGAQTSANALAAEVYPTTVRSTGVGWALGIGRLGSILGPYLGASLVGNTSRLFMMAAVPLLVASLAALGAAATTAAATGNLRTKDSSP